MDIKASRRRPSKMHCDIHGEVDAYLNRSRPRNKPLCRICHCEAMRLNRERIRMESGQPPVIPRHREEPRSKASEFQCNQCAVISEDRHALFIHKRSVHPCFENSTAEEERSILPSALGRIT